MLTLGSLFDGAGTFPFAAQQCGVKAVWASEIESFPVEVTKKRFPEMKHLGDITKVDGAEIEPVDIVTFGSPCLSTGNPRTGQGSLAVAIYGKGTRPHNKDEAQKWEEAIIANCLNVNDIGESRANEIVVMATQQGGAEIGIDLCPTITAAAGMSGNNQPVVCYALDRSSFNQGINAQYDIGIDDSGIAQTLVAKGPGAVCSIVCLGKVEVDLRRLTPTECGRLQGMPDWWCEDVPHSDSAEYKMWGNGMALPCVLYVMENVVSVLSLRLLDSLWEVSE